MNRDSPIREMRSSDVEMYYSGCMVYDPRSKGLEGFNLEYYQEGGYSRACIFDHPGGGGKAYYNGSPYWISNSPTQSYKKGIDVGRLRILRLRDNAPINPSGIEGLRVLRRWIGNILPTTDVLFKHDLELSLVGAAVFLKRRRVGTLKKGVFTPVATLAAFKRKALLMRVAEARVTNVGDKENDGA